jgi:hypothetical protein
MRQLEQLVQAAGPLTLQEVRTVMRAPGAIDAVSAQKLAQLQPFIALFPQECTGQLASLGQPSTFLAPPRCP